MADADYEKEYLKRKERNRKFYKNLPETKRIQEIYHKIMGSSSETEVDKEE